MLLAAAMLATRSPCTFVSTGRAGGSARRHLPELSLPRAPERAVAAMEGEGKGRAVVGRAVAGIHKGSFVGLSRTRLHKSREY